LIEVKNGQDLDDVKVDFKPLGTLNYRNGKFALELIVKINDPKGNIEIEIKALGKFTFQNIERANLSKLLSINSPALMYPYVRAFVSTITSVSGISPVLMPTMNLSALKVEIDESLVEEE